MVYNIKYLKKINLFKFHFKKNQERFSDFVEKQKKINRGEAVPDEAEPTVTPPDQGEAVPHVQELSNISAAPAAPESKNQAQEPVVETSSSKQSGEQVDAGERVSQILDQELEQDTGDHDEAPHSDDVSSMDVDDLGLSDVSLPPNVSRIVVDGLPDNMELDEVKENTETQVSRATENARKITKTVPITVEQSTSNQPASQDESGSEEGEVIDIT